jgi:hypothetical protein
MQRGRILVLVLGGVRVQVPARATEAEVSEAVAEAIMRALRK